MQSFHMKVLRWCQRGAAAAAPSKSDSSSDKKLIFGLLVSQIDYWESPLSRGLWTRASVWSDNSDFMLGNELMSTKMRWSYKDKQMKWPKHPRETESVSFSVDYYLESFCYHLKLQYLNVILLFHHFSHSTLCYFHGFAYTHSIRLFY